jgi:molybdopterin-containing oxidoreductase family iron-sulfur binding subunit
MCVQRIEEGKIDAKRRGEPVADGDIKTACQQSCPAQAIWFGDLNDTASAVHTDQQNPRSYGVLEEFNFQQSVSYLRVVKNRDDIEEHDGGKHV